MKNQQAQKVLSRFIDVVKDACDDDYGDFMRRMNLYIDNLKEDLRNENIDVQKKISEMQTYTQFNSNWDVDSTRSHLLSDARWLSDSAS